MPRGTPLTKKQRDQKKLDDESKKIDRELKSILKQTGCIKIKKSN